LLSGFGLGNQTYEGLVNQTKASKASTVEEEGDSIWDEDSSVKVDHAKCQSILYIQVSAYPVGCQTVSCVISLAGSLENCRRQMEYCATTLRKLIDDGSLATMDTNEIFRLARQIMEALVYMHGRNIIHRDLVRDRYTLCVY
jgi:hypothetical protein